MEASDNIRVLMLPHNLPYTPTLRPQNSLFHALVWNLHISRILVDPKTHGKSLQESVGTWKLLELGMCLGHEFC